MIGKAADEDPARAIPKWEGASLSNSAVWWIPTVADSDRDPDLPSLPPKMTELAADPNAARWALDCGWVPGTGHCPKHPCASECLFREQREAEASRIEHARRQRRRDQRAFAERMKRLTSN